MLKKINNEKRLVFVEEEVNDLNEDITSLNKDFYDIKLKFHSLSKNYLKTRLILFYVLGCLSGILGLLLITFVWGFFI